LGTEELKTSAIAQIDAQQDQLGELALKIHSNPEVGFQEVKASTWLTEYLEENGFSIERGICELPTAFRASYGKGKPAISILAEYDALPGIGHGCGHNLICTTAVGAGVASKPAIDQLGGSILVIGTPAEEGGTGKARMVERGAFKDLDFAMMVHPGVFDMAAFHPLACHNVNVEFFGKASHAASAPEAGINALEALILSYNAINSLRQHIRSKERIHGIITDGGEAANIVPAHSAGNFTVRAEDDSHLDALRQRVVDCLKGAATATGARLEYKWSDYYYAAMKNNMTAARLFADNARSIGRTAIFPDPNRPTGSTDMGNVSQVVPSIHPFVAIAPLEVSLHSVEFAEAAASEAGIKGMLDAARALAMTVIDLLAGPDTMTKVREEFKQGK
jgi:amidohydrolase